MQRQMWVAFLDLLTLFIFTLSKSSQLFCSHKSLFTYFYFYLFIHLILICSFEKKFFFNFLLSLNYFPLFVFVCSFHFLVLSFSFSNLFNFSHFNFKMFHLLLCCRFFSHFVTLVFFVIPYSLLHFITLIFFPILIFC